MDVNEGAEISSNSDTIIDLNNYDNALNNADNLNLIDALNNIDNAASIFII